jgi:hypothetical protein
VHDRKWQPQAVSAVALPARRQPGALAGGPAFDSQSTSVTMAATPRGARLVLRGAGRQVTVDNARHANAFALAAYRAAATAFRCPLAAVHTSEAYTSCQLGSWDKQAVTNAPFAPTAKASSPSARPRTRARRSWRSQRLPDTKQASQCCPLTISHELAAFNPVLGVLVVRGCRATRHAKGFVCTYRWCCRGDSGAKGCGAPGCSARKHCFLSAGECGSGGGSRGAGQGSCLE